MGQERLLSVAEDNIVAAADVHCHILPNWDDGPSTLDESLKMAEKAAKAGLKTILVTPHVGRSFGSKPERAACDIPAATAELERQIRAHGIDLTLVPGAELNLVSTDIAQRIAQEPWLTVGGQGRYVLVESPLDSWPSCADQVLFQMSLHGVTPIIAHPERLAQVQKDISIMEKLVNRGARLQITARSLIGDNRKQQECSQRLLEEGMVSFVASDAHSSKHVLPGEVEGAVSTITGDAVAQQILSANPLRMLMGKPVHVAKPTGHQIKRAKFWSVRRVLQLARQ
jgi:protein-tyrosine phosphatase